MSITHNLRIQSAQNAKMLQQLLASSELGLRFDENEFVIEGNGIYGGVYDVNLSSQKYISSAFGIGANLEVSFTEDSDGNIEEGEKIMGEAIALILRSEPGNAVFLHVIDTPILKRIKGQIGVVKENWSRWLTDSLEKADLKYKVQTVEEIERIKD